MAAFLLQGNQRFGFSHKPRNLILNHYTDYLHDNVVSVTLGDYGNLNASVSKYMYCNKNLDQLTLYGFVSHYDTCTIKSISTKQKYITDCVDESSDVEDQIYYVFDPKCAL